MKPCCACLAVAALLGTLPAQLTVDPTAKPGFASRWFAGKAEVSRFELVESRYGQPRQGHAVLVFVVEDFLRAEQVKAEVPSPASTKVLKLNFLKKFPTGVYDYSLMSSVFTPLDLAREPRSLKLTASIQEWCGQVYQQLNLRPSSGAGEAAGERGQFRVQGHSYFASEGEEDFSLPAVLLEDEVWTRIRLAPETLPQGEARLIPGVFDGRLRHRRLAVEQARCTLGPDVKGRRVYRIAYPGLGRTLKIEFETAFPHVIESFEETFSRGGRQVATRGRRTHTRMLAYWNRSGRRDAPLRQELGLPGR